MFVRVCVCERERECVCVFERECVCVFMRLCQSKVMYCETYVRVCS